MQIRKIVITDRVELEKRLNEGFPVPSGKSFFDDFPIWDPRIENPSRIQWGLFQGDALVSSISVRFAEYRAESFKTYQVAMLGGVVTQEEHRGKGYSSQLLEMILKDLDSKNIAASFLWGQSTRLYTEAGYVNAGQQWRASAAPLRELGEKGIDIRDGWNTVIFDFLKKKRIGVKYTQPDYQWVSEHKNVNWLTHWEHGVCTGFSAIGRGIDLPVQVHELEGSERAALNLLSLIARAVSNSEHLFHPRHMFKYPFLQRFQEPIREFQFLIRKKDESFPVDEVWFSGMDSC